MKAPPPGPFGCAPPLPPGAQGRRSDFPTSAVRRQEQPGPRRRLQLSGPSAFRGPLLPPAGQAQAGSGCPLPALSSGAPQLRWALVLTAPSLSCPHQTLSGLRRRQPSGASSPPATAKPPCPPAPVSPLPHGVLAHPALALPGLVQKPRGAVLKPVLWATPRPSAPRSHLLAERQNCPALDPSCSLPLCPHPLSPQSLPHLHPHSRPTA